MDVFTHAFIPYVLARIARRSEKGARLLGFGGTVPDFDTLLMWISALIPQAYVFTHRGITHTLFFSLPFSALLLFLFSRKRVASFWARFVRLDFDFTLRSLGVVYAGSLVHMTMDYLTTGGIPLLFPFTEARYAAHLFFYVDNILMVASLLVVVFFLARRPTHDKRMRILSAVLALYVVVGGVQLALKSSIDIEDASAYPTYNMFSWIIVRDDGSTFTVFDHNPLTGKTGRTSVYPYMDKGEASGLVQKARELAEVRAFMFHENAEVWVERHEGFYVLDFFDPVGRFMSETAPPGMRHFISGILVVVDDNGEVELGER